MGQKSWRVKDLSKRKRIFEPGRLVKHWLHKEWLGLVVANSLYFEKTKIYMIPGTEYEFYFRGKPAHSRWSCGRMGWMYNNWIFYVDEYHKG